MPPHPLHRLVAEGQPVVVEPVTPAGRVDGQEPGPELLVLCLAGGAVGAAVLELPAAGDALPVVKVGAVQEAGEGGEVTQGRQGHLDKRKDSLLLPNLTGFV